MDGSALFVEQKSLRLDVIPLRANSRHVPYLASDDSARSLETVVPCGETIRTLVKKLDPLEGHISR